MKLLNLIGAMALLPSSVFASSPIDNKIENVGINSNDIIFITFKKSIDELGCNHQQLLIAKDNPIRDSVMSVALTAKASDSSVIIKAKGCIGNNPTMNADPTDWGYFYIR